MSSLTNARLVAPFVKRTLPSCNTLYNTGCGRVTLSCYTRVFVLCSCNYQAMSWFNHSVKRHIINSTLITNFPCLIIIPILPINNTAHSHLQESRHWNTHPLNIHNTSNNINFIFSSRSSQLVRWKRHGAGGKRPMHSQQTVYSSYGCVYECSRCTVVIY